MQRVNCVRELLGVHDESAGAAALMSWETSSIRRHFLYYDVISLIMEEALDSSTRQSLAVQSGAFAHCSLTNPTSRALAQTHFNTDGDLAIQQAPIQNVMSDVNCLLGLSEGLFEVMTRLRALPNMTYDARDEETFWKLHKSITDWSYDEIKAAKLDIETRLDLIALAECHRITALMLLYRKDPVHHVYLPVLASKIMSTVQRIDPKSKVAVVLTPVLSLAGTELRREDEMERCKMRLGSIGKLMCTDTTAAQEVLQAIWTDRVQYDARPKWSDILREQKWTLNLA